MSQTKNFTDNIKFKDIGNAVIFGICGAFFVIFSGFFPLNFIAFFAGLPLFTSYLSKGEKVGLISSVLFFIIIAIFCSLEISMDVFLNIILPASIIGYFSTKHINKNKKIWWYPESFLLQNFVIISIISVILMSLTFHTENYMTKAYAEISKVILKNNNPETQLISRYFNSFVKYSVGAGVFSKMLATVSNLQIAHVICKKMKINIRPEFNILDLSISIWIAVLPIISLTIAQIIPSISFICSGIFVVGLFAPMLNGFSVLDFYANKKQRRSVLTSVYIALFIFPLPVILLTVLLGIVDSFYSIRLLISNSKTV